jgi:hypothetical protein
MKKYIEVFSDGSVHFRFNSFVDLKKLKIHEKDHKNFFLNKKKKIANIKNSDYSSKYKNQYLF